MYYAKIQVRDISTGVTTNYTNFDYVNINQDVTEQAGNFYAAIDNTNGTYSGTFVPGDEFICYLGSENPVTNKIFTGVIDAADHESYPSRDIIKLRGRDYGERLTDVTATEVYNWYTPGSIVLDLINKYVSGVTTTNVQQGTGSIKYVSFKHRPVWDCVKEVAGYIDYGFWIDEDKDLHFEGIGSVSTGKTLNNTNTTFSNFSLNKDDMYNKVYVYGARDTPRWQQTFTSAGSTGSMAPGSVFAGSVVTLDYKPRQTYITVDGTRKLGGIFEMSTTTASGTEYLVDYDKRKIIFVSGTTAGDNIPASGASIVVRYGKSIPIVRLKEDFDSQRDYGVRTFVMIDNEINNPTQATEICHTILDLHKNPVRDGILKSQNEYNLPISQTVSCNFPSQGINNQQFKIIGNRWKINKDTLLAENPLTINTSEVNKQHFTLVNKLNKLILDLRKLQAQDIDTEDTITKLITFTGSVGVRHNWTKIETSNTSGLSIYDRGEVTETYNNPKATYNNYSQDFGLVRVLQGGSKYREDFVDTYFKDATATTASWNTSSGAAYYLGSSSVIQEDIDASYSLTSASSTIKKTGVKIKAKKDCNMVGAKLEQVGGGEGINRWYLTNSSLTNLKSGTIVLGGSYININYNISSGTTYYLLGDRGGWNYRWEYDASAFPKTGSYINFLAGRSLIGDETGSAYTFNYVDVKNSHDGVYSDLIYLGTNTITSARVRALSGTEGYAGTKFYLSTDSGTTWTSVTTGLWHNFNVGSSLKWKADIYSGGNLSYIEVDYK